MTVRHFFLWILIVYEVSCYADFMQIQKNITQKSINNGKSDDNLSAIKNKEHKYQKNVCIDGKDISKQTKKQYLEAFIKGPCSPAIIVPGIMGTRLQVRIYCEELKQNNPKVFQQCGWHTCKKYDSGAPKSTYIIWTPDFYGRLNPLNSDDSKNCFAALLKTYHKIKDGKSLLYHLKGIKVNVQYKEKNKYGKKKSCGWDAIDNIIKWKGLRYNYLDSIKKRLRHMGYISGLTVQPFPFDWRLSTKIIIKNDRFNIIASNLHRITSKKVTIIAHSYGNNVAYRSLTLLDEAERKKIFGNFVSIAPPFQGTSQALNYALFKNFTYFGYTIWREDVYSTQSLYELLPKDTFYRFKDTEWQTEIKNLIKFYKGQLGSSMSKNESFPFLPPKDKCKYDAIRKSFSHNCNLGLFEYDKAAYVNDYQYDIKEIPELLYKFAVNDHASFESVYFDEHRLDTFHNIKIPSFVVYQTHIPTISNIKSEGHFKKNSEYFIKNKRKMTYHPGDGTVLSTSSLIPFLKWAKEKENHKVNGAESVKFVNFCSSDNQTTEAYTTQNTTKKFNNKNNEFVALDCECNQKKGYSNCNHITMLRDKHLIDFIGKILINNDRKKHVPEFIKKRVRDDDISDFVRKCKLSKGRFLKRLDHKLREKSYTNN